MQRYRQRTLKITREEVGVTEGSQALPRTPAPLPPFHPHYKSCDYTASSAPVGLAPLTIFVF